MNYRLKNNRVQAIQFQSESIDDIRNLVNGEVKVYAETYLSFLIDGSTKCVCTGDYVIKDANGKIRTCKKSDFEKLYECVS